MYIYMYIYMYVCVYIYIMALQSLKIEDNCGNMFWRIS